MSCAQPHAIREHYAFIVEITSVAIFTSNYRGLQPGIVTLVEVVIPILTVL